MPKLYSLILKFQEKRLFLGPLYLQTSSFGLISVFLGLLLAWYSNEKLNEKSFNIFIENYFFRTISTSSPSNSMASSLFRLRDRPKFSNYKRKIGDKCYVTINVTYAKKSKTVVYMTFVFKERSYFQDSICARKAKMRKKKILKPAAQHNPA